MNHGKHWTSKPDTLADAMRLRAILPDASTTKMTNAPALRASRLLRMSTFSTYTRRTVPGGKQAHGIVHSALGVHLV